MGDGNVKALIFAIPRDIGRRFRLSSIMNNRSHSGIEVNSRSVSAGQILGSSMKLIRKPQALSSSVAPTRSLRKFLQEGICC